MKVVYVWLGLVLSVGLARAQAPTPAPKPPADPVGATAPLPQQGQNPWDTGVSAEKKQAASRLFEQGNKHLDDGLSAKAAEKYREALKLWSHPAIHYNLALAIRNLDQPVQFEEHLKKAVQYGLAGLNNQQDKLDRAMDYLNLVGKQLATVEVSCKKEGAKVSVDGRQVFIVERGKPNVWKGRLPVGKHTFVAEKTGYASSVDASFVDSDRPITIELEVYTAEQLTRHKRRWPARGWMPWVVIGGGALVGIAGGAMQWSANQSYQDFDDEVARCSTAGASCDASDFANLKDSGDSKRMLGIVGYSVAGAAVVTGAVLLYLNRNVSYQITTEEYRTEQRKKQQRPAASVSVSPLVAPGMGGAMVMGRF